MSFESQSDNPEKKPPTQQELLDIQIKVENLVRGDRIHEMRNLLGTLIMMFGLASEIGWTHEKIKKWHRIVGELNALITRSKLEEAREKGLL